MQKNNLALFRLFSLLMALALVCSCQTIRQENSSEDQGKRETNQSGQKEEKEGDEEIDMNLDQTGWTKAVPQEYFQNSDKSGRIWKMDYPSKDYAGDGSDITKTAYIYTPYGYDEKDRERKYNILYLMHGWGSMEGEYFNDTQKKNLFDNLIAKGDVEPMIIVSPTFYNENSERDFSSSVREFRAFHHDFENHLMPAVEGHFHTWAGSTSPEDLKASRDHRAFGGFSLGSVTTWLQLCHDSDFIRYFLPMSGSSWYYGGFGDFRFKDNVDFLEELVQEKNLDEEGYFIFHTTGTNDSVKSQSIEMAREMISRGSFSPEHYVFYQKNGGYHDFEAVKEYLYNALPLFFKDSKEEKDPSKKSGTTLSENRSESDKKEILPMSQPFTKSTSIRQVINHPAFQNFGRLLFPLKSGYWSGNTLNDLDYIWYSYMDPDKTVEILNTLKDRSQQGEPIFFNIYSEEEMQANPELRDTGLFFFKGEPGKNFAVVNGGGGFAYVGAMHDSFPQALELSKMGYNAFALIYRPGWVTSMEDLARALSFIFKHADELEVDVNDYSLWGGSAGARMAAGMGSYGPKAFGGEDLPKPAAVITQYSGHNEVGLSDPPTYANVGTADGIANWRGMKHRLDTLASLGIDTEFHVYPGLPHGFGLGTGTIAQGWIQEAAAFWQKQIDKQQIKRADK